MPSRPVCILIILGWLATTAWFVQREVWPHLGASGPPPYTIELADEAVRTSQTRWALTRNGQRLGVVRTGLAYRDADDGFELTAIVQNIELIGSGPAQVTVREYQSRRRVTRAGALRSIHTAVTLDALGAVVKFTVSAEVIGNQIVPHCRVELQDRVLAPPLAPIELTGPSVLTPLDPVNRIHGLRPGQRWRVPLIDPLADAQRAALFALAANLIGQNATMPQPAKTPLLAAKVLGKTQWLEWERGTHECLVIDYRGDDYTARVWVRQSDGLVLRQEARAAGEELILERE